MIPSSVYFNNIIFVTSLLEGILEMVILSQGDGIHSLPENVHIRTHSYLTSLRRTKKKDEDVNER